MSIWDSAVGVAQPVNKPQIYKREKIEQRKKEGGNHATRLWTTVIAFEPDVLRYNARYKTYQWEISAARH